MTLSRLLTTTLLLGLLALAGAWPAASADCKKEDFAKAVDSAGAALRRLNADSLPKVQEGLKRLKVHLGWSDADFDERSRAFLRDGRIRELDREAAALLAGIDTAAAEGERTPVDCAKLESLKGMVTKLIATMRTKTAYSLTKIDTALSSPPAGPAAKPAAPPVMPAPPAPVAKAPPPAPKPQPPLAKARPQPGKPWNTITRPDETPPPPPAQAPSQAPAALPALPPPPPQESFTIDEIRAASKGFFGTLSTNLGSVIEYAFRRMGRPTGYVLGREGGGAFLAGVRYGKGTFYGRDGRTMQVFWHGPSIGYDVGLEGSRTMFLVYNLKQPEQIFAGFSGIDGSAYLVGGVGITFVTDGRLVMAPIRTGLGLRLGANIGYIRFTRRSTWLPF